MQKSITCHKKCMLNRYPGYHKSLARCLWYPIQKNLHPMSLVLNCIVNSIKFYRIGKTWLVPALPLWEHLVLGPPTMLNQFSTRVIFWPILWSGPSGDQPPEDLAKFGSRSDMKVKKFKNLFIFSLCTGFL